MADSEGKMILHINFGDITDQPLCLIKATPQRFRFLDGYALAHKSTIRVLEYDDLPSVPYAVISYVWSGLPPRPNVKSLLPNIYVFGADGADPISVDVLRLVALAAEQRGCGLVWLDALCILQANDYDKGWQIQRMYDIYRSCHECIVAPGGLQRLVSLTEETSWASRAWTLQEAIAPPSAHCLFAWDRGDCYFQSTMITEVKQIEKGVAAIAPLSSTLESATRGDLISVTDRKGKEMPLPSKNFSIKLFGDMSRNWARVRELIDAMDMKDEPGMFSAVWKSSFMRTAKFPVDTVFSIMGIMGVTLDTSKFKNEDRLGATIALMQGILARGEHAEWLAIATKTLPNPELSTLPVFPQIDAAWRFILETKDGMKDVEDVIDSGWRLANAPKGMIRNDGYFRFSALAASITQSKEEMTSASGFFSDTAGSWNIVPQGRGSHKAVLIGQWQQYTTGNFGKFFMMQDQCLMILKEHVPGKFSNIGYAFVEKEVVETGNWKESLFVVGGPN
ncbi:hypothetical protein GGI42DRAFT_142881 [Trichoderma sp. SZMC 28013]